MILCNPLSFDEPTSDVTALVLSGAIDRYPEGCEAAESEAPHRALSIFPDESLYED